MPNQCHSLVPNAIQTRLRCDCGDSASWCSWLHYHTASAKGARPRASWEAFTWSLLVPLPLPCETRLTRACTESMSCSCCFWRTLLLLLAKWSCFSKPSMVFIWRATSCPSFSFSVFIPSSSDRCFDSISKTLFSKTLKISNTKKLECCFPDG